MHDSICSGFARGSASPLNYQSINLPFEFLDACACLVQVFFMCQRRL